MAVCDPRSLGKAPHCLGDGKSGARPRLYWNPRMSVCKSPRWASSHTGYPTSGNIRAALLGTMLAAAACGSSEGLSLVDAPPGSVQITTISLPMGRIGDAYAATIEADGPDGLPYEWRSLGELPSGLTLRALGGQAAVLEGTPTFGGTFEVDVEVQAAVSASDRRRWTLRILGEGNQVLEIVASPADPAIVGQPFALGLEVRGADGTVMWTIEEGSVPGLAIMNAAQPQAQLSGTPSEAGQYALVVRVTDETGNVGQVPLTIEVAATGDPLTLEDQALPAATAGVEYEATITASGGAGGYTWTAIDEVPDGLTLRTEGTPSVRLSGVPTRNAFFRFRVEVRDVDGAMAQAEVQLRVDARALTVVTSTLPDGIATASYRAVIEAGGGTGAYSWRVIGQLPPGLIISERGTPATELSGILGAAGQYTFDVEVSDLAEGVARQTLTVQVAPPPEELTLLTTGVPDAVTCLGYDVPLEAVGGPGGYQWRIESGAVPPGITLDPTEGQRVELSGAPTQAGQYNFVVAVSDSTGAVRRLNASMEVADVPQIARYVVFNGSITSTTADTYVVDVCGPTPGAAQIVTPIDDQTEAVGPVRPLISPDGSKLAFVGPTTLGGFDRNIARLYVVDLTGSTPGPAVNIIPADAFRPLVSGYRWSPDSTKLAFRAQLNREDKNELFIVDVTNPSTPGAPVRVSADANPGAGEVVVGAYFWAPDSSKLAYLADLRRFETFEVYFGTLNGSIPAHDLPPVGRSVDTRIVWRADSEGVFFRGDLTTDDDFALYHVALQAGRATPLSRVSPVPVEGGDVAENRFWVSPDGQWIAFVGDLGRDESQNVYASRIVGGPQGADVPVEVNAPFMRNRQVLQVRWSPTSNALVVHSDLDRLEEYGLYYVSFVGGQAGGPVRLSPPLPADGDVASTAETEFWSADGNWVGFLADTRVDEKLELYVVDLRIPPPWQPVLVSPTTTNIFRDAFRFEFAPDGSRIALMGDYGRVDRFELWSVDLRGPAPTPAFRLHGDLPFGATIALTDDDTAWKQDGSAIFFRGDLEVLFQTELWMADLTADGRRPPARVNPLMFPLGDVNKFGFTP